MYNPQDTTSGTGTIDGTKKGFWSRPSTLVAASIVVLAAIGGGSFAVASTLTGASAPTLTTLAPTRTPSVGTLQGGRNFRGAAGLARLGTEGTVASTGSSSFVIRTQTGATDTVKVSSSTTYRDRTSVSAGLSDLKVGDVVIVTGTTSGSTITAKSVTIAPAGGGAGGRFGFGGSRPTFGKVTSVGSDSFALTTSAGSNVTVKVTSSTAYVDRTSSSSASLADVTVGSTVVVVGTTNGAMITAATVAIVPPGGFGGGGGEGFGGGDFGGNSSGAPSSSS